MVLSSLVERASSVVWEYVGRVIIERILSILVGIDWRSRFLRGNSIALSLGDLTPLTILYLNNQIISDK
jgi:hypothetical protein